MQTTATVLLADADVLIDYRDSELAILELVSRHAGRVAVISTVLGTDQPTGGIFAHRVNRSSSPNSSYFGRRPEWASPF